MTDRFPRTPDSNAPLFDPGAKDGGWSLLDGGLLDDSPQHPRLRPDADRDPVDRRLGRVRPVHARAHRRAAEGLPLLGRLLARLPRGGSRDAPAHSPQLQHRDRAGTSRPRRGPAPAQERHAAAHRPRRCPAWKQSHLRRNYDAFEAHWRDILPWAWRWGVYTDLFPASRRKLEWQAQDAKSLWDTVMHFRPSGIRAKRPTYLPALVAITQTSIVGPRERRLSPRETARLQGLPDTFVFPDQPASATYKQMGNGVAIGAVQHVFREHVLRDADLLEQLRGAGGHVPRQRTLPTTRTASGSGWWRRLRATPPAKVRKVLDGHRPATVARLDGGPSAHR